MSRAKSPTKKIERLTPAQEKALAVYREEWLAHGRSCAPSDREACERIWREMYAAIGEKPPMIFWWDGPATCAMAILLLKSNLGANLRGNLWANLGDNLRANLGANLRDNLGANLRANLGDNLWANLWDNLWANLGDNLRANLGANLWANLWANLRGNLWANLRDNLRANLGANLRDNLGANLRDNLGANLRANLGANLWANLRDNLRDNLWANLPWFWGQHESSWPAYYFWPHSALRNMHTKEQSIRLSWWLDLCRSTGWWHPYKNIVMACERPERQAVDSQGRLHHESKAALLCRDGWPLYAWHGVRVPAQVIENPDEITPKSIDSEANAEVRRVMIERYGAARYIVDSGAKKEHTDDYGTLYRKVRQDDSDLVMVKVVNSTPEPDGSFKDYFLRVPPEMKTARGAVAWTFGKNETEYAPEAQT